MLGAFRFWMQTYYFGVSNTLELRSDQHPIEMIRVTGSKGINLGKMQKLLRR